MRAEIGKTLLFGTSYPPHFPRKTQHTSQLISSEESRDIYTHRKPFEKLSLSPHAWSGCIIDCTRTWKSEKKKARENSKYSRVKLGSKALSLTIARRKSIVSCVEREKFALLRFPYALFETFRRLYDGYVAINVLTPEAFARGNASERIESPALRYARVGWGVRGGFLIFGIWGGYFARFSVKRFRRYVECIRIWMLFEKYPGFFKYFGVGGMNSMTMILLSVVERISEKYFRAFYKSV